MSDSIRDAQATTSTAGQKAAQAHDAIAQGLLDMINGGANNGQLNAAEVAAFVKDAKKALSESAQHNAQLNDAIADNLLNLVNGGGSTYQFDATEVADFVKDAKKALSESAQYGTKTNEAIAQELLNLVNGGAKIDSAVVENSEFSGKAGEFIDRPDLNTFSVNGKLPEEMIADEMAQTGKTLNRKR